MANKYAKESVKETVTKKTSNLAPTRVCNWLRRKEKQEKAMSETCQDRIPRSPSLTKLEKTFQLTEGRKHIYAIRIQGMWRM